MGSVGGQQRAEYQSPHGVKRASVRGRGQQWAIGFIRQIDQITKSVKDNGSQISH